MGIQMDRVNAWQAIKDFSNDEFKEKIKTAQLPEERQDLLLKFIQGKIQVSIDCKIDIEEYALKQLMGTFYESSTPQWHPYSSGEFYEYDPAKNGQNIIKHGIGFSEVISYSGGRFGVLQVPFPHKTDGQRYAVFSDLNLKHRGDKLAMPLPSTRDMNYTFSITTFREGKYRFISSRLLSSKKPKYKKTVEQVFKEIIPDEKERRGVIDRCVEIIERDLIHPAQPPFRARLIVVEPNLHD